jgi:uncharacterized protein with LGFP repeats
MNKLTIKGLFAILFMTAILLAACAPQAQLSSMKQAVPERAIRGLYQQMGKEKGILGAPVSTDLEDAGDGWKMWHYGCGRIYSNPVSGTFEVYGPIMNQWLALGGGKGPIGYPTGHPLDANNGKGKSQAFQNALLLWQGYGPVEIFSSLTSLDLIEKAKIGLRK